MFIKTAEKYFVEIFYLKGISVNCVYGPIQTVIGLWMILYSFITTIIGGGIENGKLWFQILVMNL